MTTGALVETSEIVSIDEEGELWPVVVGTYPDGTPHVMKWPLRNIAGLMVRPKSQTMFLAALTYAHALKERGKISRNGLNLFLPLVPGSRQDRLNREGDYLVTAKFIATMINSVGFGKVTILDPHSDVISALIDRCSVITPDRIVKWYCDHPDLQLYKGVISPDAGAEKRAFGVARSLGVPMFHAWKSRSMGDGSLNGFGVEYLAPGHYLVVDDICDGGGTFVGLGKETIKWGATADLYVTHGMFTKGLEGLCPYYHRVFTTDSIINNEFDHPALTIIRCVEKMFLKGI